MWVFFFLFSKLTKHRCAPCTQHLKVHLSCRPLPSLADRNTGSGGGEGEFSAQLWVLVRLCVKILLFWSSFLPTGSSPGAGRMASAHDRAVLQAIFNPSSPFGSSSGPDTEEESFDDGESVSTYHVTPFFSVYHFIAYSHDLKSSHSWAKKTKEINKINMTF